MDSGRVDATGEWAGQLPESFPVSVVMAREAVADNPWIDCRWRVLGVVAGRRPAERQLVKQGEGKDEFLVGGFEVFLHRDECESYYHNLRAPRPECYVLLRTDTDEPEPFRISLSFDEAHAYLEGEDVDLQVVDLPPELYRWLEAFVLAHYVPEPRKKRKRTDWRRKSGT